LAYMIGGSNTAGKTYETTVFNDKYPTTNPVTGEALSPTPFYNTSVGFSADLDVGLPLPTLNLNRVYVLSTAGTCSASEALINGLRGADVEVVLIGNTTCGKPYGFYATDNCGTTYFTVQFRGENNKGFGDYADGFSPMNASGRVGELVNGCVVADDYSKPLGDVEEDLLNTALEYRLSETCPVSSVGSQKVNMFSKTSQPGEGNLLSDPRVRKHLQMQQIRLDNLNLRH